VVRLVPAGCLDTRLKIGRPEGFAFANSPVFMRVRGNMPQFTISLSEGNVNGFCWVSTGFLRFF
jgi:hypothetical protein